MSYLNYRIYGEHGDYVIILHGLLGMLDNWHSFAKALSENYRVICIDQRNHGRSFKSVEFTYELLATDLAAFLDQQNILEAHLIGHSMGGKTVMHFLDLFPEKSLKSIIVDIGAKAYKGGHEDIFKALLAIDINKVNSRKEVQDSLMVSINDLGVVLFLMKNLSRNPEGYYEWKANIKALYTNYPNIIKAIDVNAPVNSDILFVKGGKSKYIREEDKESLLDIFPFAKFETIKNAGHWVHADSKDELLNIVRQYLN